MWDVVRRSAATLLRGLSTCGSALDAVPDPHGQFPGTPISWYVNENVPDPTVAEQPVVPPWHPEGC